METFDVHLSYLTLCYFSQALRVKSYSKALRYFELEYMQLLLAALGWLVLKQQDAVALATFDSQVRAAIRPSSEAAQTQGIVRVLEDVSPSRASDFAAAGRDLASRWTRRGVVIVATDALAEIDAIVSGFSALSARKHDVLLWHVLDRAEWDFPFTGPLKIAGLEATGSQELDGSHVQAAYREEIARHCKQLESRCGSMEIDYVRFFTDEPLDHVLTRALRHRTVL